MENLKRFEEYKFINIAGNSEKDKNEPFFNIYKTKYKENKKERKRKDTLITCGIDPYSIRDYDDLSSKLNIFNMYITTPFIITDKGYAKKETRFRCYVKERYDNKSTNDKNIYLIDIYPYNDMGEGPGAPTGKDQDSWGEYGTFFIPKCIIIDIDNKKFIDKNTSLFQCLYKIIDDIKVNR